MNELLFPPYFSQARLLSIIFVFPRQAGSSHSHSSTVPALDGHACYFWKRGEPQVFRSSLWAQLICYARLKYKAKFQIYYPSNSQSQLSTPENKFCWAQFFCQTLFFFFSYSSQSQPKGDYKGRSYTSLSKENFPTHTLCL